ncbi:MAG: N-acetylmuramoyl-L-alanine amidase-like domain-containing protein [Gammaproteobacteria bacterium]
MQFFQRRYKLKIFGLLCLLAKLSYANKITTYPFCESKFRQQTETAVQKIYTKTTTPTYLPARIQYFSQLFLNKPYALTALGEGRNAEFDQGPLYRFDAFDCLTYVETVLALAFSDSAAQFKQRINHIRYEHGKIGYLQRHHFTSPDWNTFNQQQGLLQDITEKLVDQNHHPIALYAQTTIDQANWYQHFNQDKIRLCGATEEVNQQRLQQLRKMGQPLPNKQSRIAYIPIKALTGKDKNSQFLLDQIPSGAIIEIVRPNWDLTQIIGTHLNVSHIGFAIREHGDLYFYQASSLENKVFKIPLADYLISMLSSPTIRGINIQVAVARTTSLP